MAKSLLKKLEIASLVAGLALFAYLIKKTGVGTITDYISMLGWGALIIIGLSALRNCFRAASWYFAVEPEHRNISFWSLTHIMLAGEAIKYLTATGPLLGEPAKAAMVRRQVPLLYGFSSIIVETLIYNLTVIFFMLAGLPALAWLVTVPAPIERAIYIFSIGIVLMVLTAWLAMRRRWYFSSNLIQRLVRRRAARNRPVARLQALGARARSLEENVYTFYERRRGAFYLIFAFNMASHLINVVEVYVILDLMQLPASLSAGFVVEAFTKIINSAFFFVPTRAGVYESGNALVLKTLGMSAEAGVALAIIRKLRAFVWVGYGLGVIASLAIRDRRAKDSPDAEQAGEDKAADLKFEI